MIRQTKLCVVLLALAVCGYGLPKPGFCADYNQVEDFGVLQPVKTIQFTVTPPQNAEGKNARVTKGFYDSDDLRWKGGPATWNSTITPDYPSSHIGKFYGEYGYPGTNRGRALTWTATSMVEVVKLETITDATIPSNRARKKLGVGENDTLTLIGADGSVTWSLSGPGTLSGTSGNSVTFTAYERASSASVIATYKGKTFPASFTVVEPSGAIIEQEPGTGVWHIQGEPSCGFKGRPYIQPADVSFEKIQIREGAVNGVGTGYFSYQNGNPHPVGPWAPIESVTEGKGSKVQGVDMIRGWTDNHTPYEDGSFTWAIPWYFRVGTGSEKQFPTPLNHVKTIDATGKLTISKGGTTKSAELNDPTSNW